MVTKHASILIVSVFNVLSSVANVYMLNYSNDDVCRIETTLMINILIKIEDILNISFFELKLFLFFELHKLAITYIFCIQ